jgi:hypothetical protein
MVVLAWSSGGYRLSGICDTGSDRYPYRRPNVFTVHGNGSGKCIWADMVLAVGRAMRRPCCSFLDVVHV